MNAEERLYPDFDDHVGRDTRHAFERLDLRHYLRTIGKYRLPIVAFTAAITMLAAYYALTAVPVYQATATLLIEEQKANVVSIEELYGVNSGNEDYYQTQYELLRSRSLAARVIDSMELWNDPLLAPDSLPQIAVAPDATNAGSDPNTALEGRSDVAVDLVESDGLAKTTGTTSTQDGRTINSVNAAYEASSEADIRADSREALVVSAFLSRLSIDPIRNTKLVSISFESPDAVQAARVANAVAEHYIDSHLDSRMAMTEKASRWLSDRVAQLKQELDDSEQRLNDYKLENELVDVDGSVGRLNEQEILLLTSELAEARNVLSDTRDLVGAIDSIGDRPKALESLPAMQANGILQSVKIEQGFAQRTLDELLNRYGENHPRVIDARSALATLDQTLAQTMQRVAGGIRNDLRLQQRRVAALESQISQGKQAIQVIGSKKFELDNLQREVDTNRNLYNQFFGRMIEARSADGLEAANARVSDVAQVPSDPIKPRKQLIIALAGLASFGFALLMAILREQMNDSVVNTHDVESELELPLLGILPLIKLGYLARKRKVPLNPLEIKDPKNTYKEAVNTVRTAVLGKDAKRSPQVILVTSSVPGEGKSTTALSLAFSLARLERVLLVDCDLRRPTIAHVIGLGDETPGLVNVITGQAKVGDVLQRGVFDGAVDVLTSGPTPDQPLELLSSPRLARMFDSLREHYDRIVIDSAPAQAVSDAIVLSRWSDCTLYVIKSHDTGLEMARRGLQRLRSAGARVTGAVVTQVDIDALSSYGGDYHYQGYYDHYGYVSSGARKASAPGVMTLSPSELRRLQADPGEHFELGLASTTCRTRADIDLGERSSKSPGAIDADRERRLNSLLS